MAETAKQNVPENVVMTFEEFLGIKVDPSKIQVFPDDGYIDPHYGRFDWYLLRREGAIYKVRKYKNGKVHFG